jgi:hypothetical protein
MTSSELADVELLRRQLALDDVLGARLRHQLELARVAAGAVRSGCVELKPLVDYTKTHTKDCDERQKQQENDRLDF